MINRPRQGGFPPRPRGGGGFEDSIARSTSKGGKHNI